MTVDFSRDVMIGMLRKGKTGDQILDILNVLVPDQDEVTDEQVSEDTETVEYPDAEFDHQSEYEDELVAA